MADVFISYKRTERPRVQLIESMLREEELSVWFDARLEVGSGEGFDSEIEREVTSAGSVLVCWTAEALKSVYVRAEAKKGLERDVLVPVFLEPCSLPIPFNAVDTADLSTWSGDRGDATWQRVVEKLRECRDRSQRDREAMMVRSAKAYDRVDHKIFPGTLTLLATRIAALDERDVAHYNDDINALLAWIDSIAGKEVKHAADGYALAERQSGGSAWYFWENGDARRRALEFEGILNQLASITQKLKESRKIWELDAP